MRPPRGLWPDCDDVFGKSSRFQRDAICLPAQIGNDLVPYGFLTKSAVDCHRVHSGHWRIGHWVCDRPAVPMPFGRKKIIYHGFGDLSQGRSWRGSVILELMLVAAGHSRGIGAAARRVVDALLLSATVIPGRQMAKNHVCLVNDDLCDCACLCPCHGGRDYSDCSDWRGVFPTSFIVFFMTCVRLACDPPARNPAQRPSGRPMQIGLLWPRVRDFSTNPMVLPVDHGTTLGGWRVFARPTLMLVQSDLCRLMTAPRAFRFGSASRRWSLWQPSELAECVILFVRLGMAADRDTGAGLANRAVRN